MSWYFIAEYYKNKNIFKKLVAIKGTLISYDMNARNQRINPIDIMHTQWDISKVFLNPAVHYQYTYNKEGFSATKLSLLGGANNKTLNSFLGPKPKEIVVYIDPLNPKQSVLCLGQFKRREIVLYYSFLLTVFTFYTSYFN